MAEYLIQGKTLDEIAHAINEKGGWQNIYRADEMAEAIESIPTGGGGGSGYAKKTGSFVLASDYTYANQANQAYTGSILIKTGLSHIDSLIVWSEEWAKGEATTNCFGLSMAFPEKPPLNTNAAEPCHYYSGYSTMRNGTNNLASSSAQGVFFHSMSSNIADGSFGLRCHSSNFPIKAGHTIRWEAWGAE